MDVTRQMNRDEKGRRQRLVDAVIIALIFAILPYFVCYYLYLHIHTLPDGRVVVHSHATPENEDNRGRPNHSHSNSEIIFFNAFGLAFDKAIIATIIVVIISYNFL